MAIDYQNLNKLQRRSVQEPGNGGLAGFNAADYVISMASFADTIPAWGSAQVRRDKALRTFWPTEYWLSSTVASLAARNAAFSFTIDGPKATVKRIQDALAMSDLGDGWISLWLKASADLYSQDNGAFIEVIRESNSPEAPFLGLAHLDSGRCTRTGDLEHPVTYEDTKGIQHKMGRWQVMEVVDMPSPIETMNGVGFCAVSRVLRFSQIMRDIAVYQHEKVSGRFAGAVHLVSGVQGERIEAAIKQADRRADDQGYQVFQKPPIVATLDPTATIQVATIMLKSLPDNYDPENDRKWFVSVLALAFGCDYQDLAPLPSGNMGTSAQSQILHLKSRGKGPELFQKMVEHRLNFWVLPKNLTFSYKEMDLEAESVKAGVDKVKAEARSVDIASGVMTPAVARQIMADKGELEPQYLDMLNQEDLTPDVSVGDEAPLEEPEEIGSNVTVEDQEQVQPQLMLDGQIEKELKDDDYGGKRRRQLEDEMVEDFAKTLMEMGKAVEARVRREMRNEPD